MEGLNEQASRLEALLPLLMRSIYPSGEEPLSDLPVGQLRVVRQLDEGCRTATELAHELGLTQGAITQLLQRLEDAGVVERITDEADRRVRRISLSKEGRQQLELRRAGRHRRAALTLQRLSKERRAEVLAAMETLLQAAQPDTLVFTGTMELVSSPSLVPSATIPHTQEGA